MKIVSVKPSLSTYRTLGDVKVVVAFDLLVDPETVTAESFYVTEGLENDAPPVEGSRSKSDSSCLEYR